MTTKDIAEVWNMVVVRGDRWPHRSFTVKDQDSVNISLSGATITMQIKNEDTDTTSVKTLTNSDGFTVAGSTVTFDDTVDIAVGTYQYDIEVLLSGYVAPFTIYRGTVKVMQDVTRA